jgi:hypothetical protein
MRNAILFIAQLYEFIQVNQPEVCRFDSFYILKNALVQSHLMKERLDA